MLMPAVSPGTLALALGGVALMAFPVIYWDALYDKLWLLPLACCCFAAGVALRADLLPRRSLRLLTALLLVSISVEVAVNVPRLIAAHTQPTPHLEEARAFAANVGPNDSVVLDFDEVSSLWLAIWGQKSNTLMLPSSNLSQASAWLSQAKTLCRVRNGRILFVGVLQHHRADWDAFLGPQNGYTIRLSG